MKFAPVITIARFCADGRSPMAGVNIAVRASLRAAAVLVLPIVYFIFLTASIASNLVS